MPADSSTFLPDPASFPARHYRTVLFYGEEGFERIQKAKVTVVGLGGVGAHAAANLARSGIGEVHLVDFDTVSESSLNRSPFAEPADIGKKKTDVLRDYLTRICPDTAVTVTEAFCGDETLPELASPDPENRPAMVIDAIDSLNPKVGLLTWCMGHDIPVITSLGAAGKWDVGQVRTGDLADSTICPLAKKVRQRLKRRGVDRGIQAIWSVEKAYAHRPGVPKEMVEAPEVDPKSASYLTTRERHTLASQMTLPGVFGYGLAAMALDKISRKESR